MTITRSNGLNQVCCDSCPASYPNTYPDEFWSVMISDAKSAGWAIRKVAPRSDGDTADLFGSTHASAISADEPYTHTCSARLNPLPTGGLL